MSTTAYERKLERNRLYQKEHRERIADYYKEWKKQRYHERRTFWLAELGGKCVRCGATEDLAFDHIDRTTKTDRFCNLLSGAEERLREEMKLAQLLCRVCHNTKSANERHHG